MRLFALCPDWRTDSGTHYFPMGISDPIPSGQLVQAEIPSPQQNEWEERKKVAFARTTGSNPLTLTNLPKPLGHTTYLFSQLCEPRKFRSRLLCPPPPLSLFFLFLFHYVFLFAFKDLNLIEGGQKSRTACCPRIVLQLQAFEACIQIENFLTCQSMRSFIPHALLLWRCIHCRDLANFCPLGSGED